MRPKHGNNPDSVSAPKANAKISEILDKTQSNLILRSKPWSWHRFRISAIGLPSITCLIALFFLILFSIKSFLQNQILHGQLLLVFALLFVCCFIYIQLTGNKRTTKTFIVFLFAVLALILFITGGVNNTGPLWYFVFPLTALFILRLWAGLLSIFLLFFFTILVYSIPIPGLDLPLYSQDFIQRFFAVYITVSALSFFYAFSRTSTELQMDNMYRNYREMANTDELTSLANRRRMTDILNGKASRSNRNNRSFSVIIFDLDYFKKINDSYGHDAGDDVLRTIPVILTKILRVQDDCGRWGGEEFLILLPDTDLEGARQVAERLRLEFEGHPIKHNSHSLSVTISLGVSEYRLNEKLEDCLKRADENLYRAKKSGRNLVSAE